MKFPFKSVQPSKANEALRNELLALLKKHPELSSEEIIAMLAYTTGQCVAMLDQRKYTGAMAMELISKNIEAGNAHMLDELKNLKGTKQ